jgi:hypothetical protein
MNHPFLTKTIIPKELPHYLMTAPPSIDWIQKFWPKARLISDELKGRLNMELPRVTMDEDKDLGRNQKFKRNQSVAVPGLLSVEKAQNFLGDHLGGGLNNVSLLSARSKHNTSSAKLVSGNLDATSQQSFDSNSRKVGSPVSPS